MCVEKEQKSSDEEPHKTIGGRSHHRPSAMDIFEAVPPPLHQKIKNSKSTPVFTFTNYDIDTALELGEQIYKQNQQQQQQTVHLVDNNNF